MNLKDAKLRDPLYHHEEDKPYPFAGILLTPRINYTTIVLVLIAIGYGITFVIFNWKH